MGGKEKQSTPENPSFFAPAKRGPQEKNQGGDVGELHVWNLRVVKWDEDRFG